MPSFYISLFNVGSIINNVVLTITVSTRGIIDLHNMFSVLNLAYINVYD